MTLAPGTRVGVYEVVSLLGAGGMGEVYRARDPRLQRDVALKILPDVFAADPDRLARFQREAQVLASLAHPNIGHIYGLEESGAVRALVLELIEGPTLADRIARGPIAIEEALPIARQIADALDAAHEHGVIHRDLKPANIKVRDDGTVKVLDFGLAKLTQASGPGPQAPELTASPTLSAAFTGAGIILGTAAYMAPEQARGKVVDKRADIWAFGCVLFEILAGTRAFDGTDATEMIAAVIRAEPDWSALPSDTPPRLRALLKRCLQKDPRQRLRDVGDVRFELEEVFNMPASADAAAAPAARAPMWRRVLPSAAAVLITAMVVGYAAWTLRPEPSRPLVRFVINLPEGDQFTNAGRHLIAISPAGTHLAYAASGRLYLRALDQLEATALRGTEGAINSQTESGRSPFFSPDGQWVGFWQNGELKKMSVTGGTPVTICAAENPWGASWGADDTIVFGQGAEGIWRVSAAGGTPEVLIKVDAGQMAHGPQMLPGGRAVLFTLRQGATSWDEAQIVVQSLGSGTRKVLVDGTDARYVPAGYLVYAVQGTLLAVPFDLESLDVTGGPVPLVEDVTQATAAFTGAAHFSVSGEGTLVYVSGNIVAPTSRTLTWVDRQGREEPLKAPNRTYRYPRLSPDGQRVALDIRDEQRDVWIWHLLGQTLTRLTLDAAQAEYGVWTSDSRRVIFSSPRSGIPSLSLFWQASDGTGSAELLIESQNVKFPYSVSPDGTQLVFSEDAPGTGNNLMMLPLQGEHRPQPLVQTPFSERNGEFSPDGRWLAYESNESGGWEIYVRPFPNVNDGRWQISSGGGTRPLWARNGQELFYVTPAGDALMSARISGTSVFKSSNPAKIFDVGAYYLPYDPGGSGDAGRTYDVSADGRRFLMIKTVAESNQTTEQASITVVQNWFEELKRRVPVP